MSKEQIRVNLKQGSHTKHDDIIIPHTQKNSVKKKMMALQKRSCRQPSETTNQTALRQVERCSSQTRWNYGLTGVESVGGGAPNEWPSELHPV